MAVKYKIYDSICLKLDHVSFVMLALNKDALDKFREVRRSTNGTWNMELPEKSFSELLSDGYLSDEFKKAKDRAEEIAINRAQNTTKFSCIFRRHVLRDASLHEASSLIKDTEGAQLSLKYDLI